MRLSVKQLSMFACPRRWAFRYLDKDYPSYLPPYLADGIEFHRCMAALVATGKLPDEVLPESHFGRLCRAAIRFVEQRAWSVEYVGSFEYETSGGVRCTIDLRPDLMAPGYLIDFKTTSSKRYALRSLEEDIQANVYAYGMGCPAVSARWIYVDKRTYDAWPVDHTFFRDATTRWLRQNIDRTIELMHQFEQDDFSAIDLPADLEACGGVGRFCDYAGKCLTGPVGASPSLVSLESIIRYKEMK